MCHLRRVLRVYLCPHTGSDWVPVRCIAPNCVLSPMHPEDCTGLECQLSCYQGYQAPERSNPWFIQDYCPACRAAGFSR